MKKKIVGNLPVGYRLHGEKFTYEIETALGQGGFGITYLARIVFEGSLGGLRNLKQYVAIKEFYMHEINGRDESQVLNGTHSATFQNYHGRFMKEAINLSKMDHPGIVNIMEIFNANGTSYYVMEYLSGGTLEKAIEQKGHLEASEALDYILKIGDALGYMHSKHMLHLDIKPQNIGLTDTEEPVLIDFGLSKVFDDNGQPESSTSIGGGTQGYSPLEQLNYDPAKGLAPTLDIYALGATLFKMLTGKTPPHATLVLDDDEKILDNHLSKAGIDREIICLVEWAMEPRKRKRPQSVVEYLERIKTMHDNLKAAETEPTEDVSEAGTDALTDNPEYRFDTRECIPESILATYESYAKEACCGLVSVEKNKLCGCIDRTGKEQIPCIYTYAFINAPGYIIVCKDGKWGALSLAGKVIIPIIYEKLGTYDKDSNLIDACLNDKRGYLNLKGETVIPFIYDGALFFEDGYAPVKMGEKWGLINTRNQIIIPFIYDNVDWPDEYLVKVSQANKWGYVNLNGETVIPYIYDNISFFSKDGYAEVRKGNETYHIDRHGNRVFVNHPDTLPYDRIRSYSITDTEPEKETPHFINIHGFRIKVGYEPDPDMLLCNNLEYLLGSMKQCTLPGTDTHYHVRNFGTLYGIANPGVTARREFWDDGSTLDFFIEHIDILRRYTSLPFRMGTPEEVMNYSRYCLDKARTHRTDQEEMYALDPKTGKFSLINIYTEAERPFYLSERIQADILLVLDCKETPLEDQRGYDRIEPFAFSCYLGYKDHRCDLLDGQMNVVDSWRDWGYTTYIYTYRSCDDITDGFMHPKEKTGEPYIGNLFIIETDVKETSLLPRIYHLGENLIPEPGFKPVPEDTLPFEEE